MTDEEPEEVRFYEKDGMVYIDLSDVTFEDGDTPETNPRDFARVFEAVAVMFEAHLAIQKAAKG